MPDEGALIAVSDGHGTVEMTRTSCIGPMSFVRKPQFTGVKPSRSLFRWLSRSRYLRVSLRILIFSLRTSQSTQEGITLDC